MQKEELKQYLNAAIDALSYEELNMFMFTLKSDEPDLLSVGQEVVTLKGEVKKMNTISLKLSGEINAMFEKTKKENEKDSVLSKDLKRVLLKITAQDELMMRTKYHFDELPEMSRFLNRNFKKKFFAWKDGFNIQHKKWEKFMTSIDMERTGLEDEVFNKEYHEAIEIVSKSSIEHMQITENQEIGYLYNNILIKRAKVTVNKL